MVYILCWLGFEYAYGFERVSMCLIFHFSRDFYCSGILFKFAARSLPVRTFSLTFTQTEASKRFVYLSVYLYESVHIVTNTYKYIRIYVYVYMCLRMQQPVLELEAATTPTLDCQTLGRVVGDVHKTAATATTKVMTLLHSYLIAGWRVTQLRKLLFIHKYVCIYYI